MASSSALSLPGYNPPFILSFDKVSFEVMFAGTLSKEVQERSLPPPSSQLEVLLFFASKFFFILFDHSPFRAARACYVNYRRKTYLVGP